MLRVLLLLCGLVLAFAAEAGMKAGPNVMPDGHHRLRVPGGVAPPLDGLTAARGAYGFRKLRTAYAGNAVQLRRASDSTVLDIGFTAAGDFDVAAATTFCNATSCFLAKWYDQSGGARDAVQATAAAQPALIFACNGARPCARTTTASQNISSGSVTPATGVMTLSMVANRRSGTGKCYWVTQNSLNLFTAHDTVANEWELSNSSTPVDVTASDAAWHAGIGVINGAASLARIDSTETTGLSIAGSTTAGSMYVISAFSGTSTCDEVEAIVWDNYVLTAGERAALVNNQRAFWGF